MARIIQIIAHDEGEHIVNGLWHAITNYPYNATVCGIQLEGEDGCVASEEREGKVTCETCRSVLSAIQSIQNWK